MRRVFIVLELRDDSLFDPESDVDLDELAEDSLDPRRERGERLRFMGRPQACIKGLGAAAASDRV